MINLELLHKPSDLTLYLHTGEFDLDGFFVKRSADVSLISQNVPLMKSPAALLLQHRDVEKEMDLDLGLTSHIQLSQC